METLKRPLEPPKKQNDSAQNPQIDSIEMSQEDLNEIVGGFDGGDGLHLNHNETATTSKQTQKLEARKSKSTQSAELSEADLNAISGGFDGGDCLSANHNETMAIAEIFSECQRHEESIKTQQIGSFCG